MEMTSDFVVLSRHGWANVLYDRATGRRSLYSARHILAGEAVCQITFAGMSESPTDHSFQAGNRLHTTLKPIYAHAINHSCAPNVFVAKAMLI